MPYAIGAYSEVLVSRGFTNYGMAPPQELIFTNEQLKAFQQQAEKVEMPHCLVQGMNDNITDKDKMDKLACDLLVNFAEPSKEPPRKKKVAAQKDSMDDLRMTSLTAGTLGTKKLKATAPEIWSGMIQQTKSGGKWVTIRQR
jgi:hypothetical protein